MKKIEEFASRCKSRILDKIIIILGRWSAGVFATSKRLAMDIKVVFFWALSNLAASKWLSFQGHVPEAVFAERGSRRPCNGDSHEIRGINNESYDYSGERVLVNLRGEARRGETKYTYPPYYYHRIRFHDAEPDNQTKTTEGFSQGQRRTEIRTRETGRRDAQIPFCNDGPKGPRKAKGTYPT